MLSKVMVIKYFTKVMFDHVKETCYQIPSILPRKWPTSDLICTWLNILMHGCNPYNTSHDHCDRVPYRIRKRVWNILSNVLAFITWLCDIEYLMTSKLTRKYVSESRLIGYFPFSLDQITFRNDSKSCFRVDAQVRNRTRMSKSARISATRLD